MSKKTIVVLAALALALLGYIVVFERASVTSKERAGRSGRVLVSFVRDKVERLTLQRHDTRVVLTRKLPSDGSLSGFRVVEPYAAKADDDVVDRVLGELEWLSARRTLDNLSKEDLTRFGLASPRYRVSYQSGREQHTLSVGAGDVHGESLYVRVDDEPRAYVVPRTLLDVLDLEPGGYREKQLFADLTVAWAKKLALREGGNTRSLVREQGRWWTEPGPAAPRSYADEKRIDELLHALSELRAARYLDVDQQAQAASLFSAPALRIEVAQVPDEAREDQRARQFVLELAGPCAGHSDERSARCTVTGVAPTYACIADSELKPFALGTDALREPRLFRSDVHGITRFVLTRDKDKLALQREGTGWKAQSGVAVEQAGPIDGAAVDAWLTDLAAARATAFAPATGFQEHGSLVLELMDKTSERVALGALGADGELAVKRGDEPLLVSFPGSVFDRLQPSRGRFAALTLWSGKQPSAVSRITARSATLSRVLTLEGGRWKASDASSPVDSDRIRVLVRALLDVHVRGYLSLTARPAHGFGETKPRVELGLVEDTPLTLALGAATDHGAYARVNDGAVLEVGAEVDALITELAGGARMELTTIDADEDEEAEAEHEQHAH